MEQDPIPNKLLGGADGSQSSENGDSNSRTSSVVDDSLDFEMQMNEINAMVAQSDSAAATNFASLRKVESGEKSVDEPGKGLFCLLDFT